MKRHWFVAFFSLVVLTFFLLVLRLQASPPQAVFVVDTLVDEADGSCIDGDCSLRDAIHVAGAFNDRIIFDESLSGGVIDIAALGPLRIERNMTISGTVPVEINGGGVVGIFEIADDVNVNFFSLRITNGYREQGGAIRAQRYSYMSLQNMTIDNNSAVEGGAIYSNGQVVIVGSTVMSNTAETGGAIVLPFNAYSLFAYQSRFIGNSATGAGGVVKNDGSFPLTFNKVLFEENSAEFGGVIASFNLADLYVDESTFRHNTADYGGAIAVDVSQTDLMIQRSLFIDNVAATAGGAIFSRSNYKVLIENSTFTGNMVTGSDNGTDGGGAVAMAQPGVDIDIVNSTIISNTAPNVNGRDGLWLTDGQMVVRNTIVVQNGLVGCDVAGGVFDGNASSMNDDGSCAGFLIADPMLAPLADNGGDSLTYALLPGSPAIDGGSNGNCPSTDQRRTPRPTDGDGDLNYVCDVGAFEFVNYSEYAYLSAIFRP